MIKILFALFLFTICAIHEVQSLECRIVEEGHHYPSLVPFHGFNHDVTISTRVRFDNNTAHYLFPPTEDKGRECMQSWNQLWGATRCGYLVDNHEDSDRFVWRRAGSCLIYDSKGHVIGEKTNCSESNLIELAAAAYDHGLKPYQHPGTLEKEFTIKARINTWYGLTLTFTHNQTIYQLFDDSDLILETQTIDHRVCLEYHHGTMQSFYFGGECVAPQTVSACYDEN